jgi:glycosyltransferase involved in cell wall biosynthesis
MARVALVGGFGDLVIAFRGPLIADLTARGHAVDVLVPPADPNLEPAIAAGIRERGGRWLVSPLDRTGTNPLKERQARRWFRSTFRRERYDVVLAYNPKPIFHAVPAAKDAGVPMVGAMVTGLGFAFIGGSLRARALGVVARYLYRAAMRRADVVFFQNPDDEATFRAKGLLGGAARIVRIAGSGVDTAAFAARPVPETERPVFLMVARLLRDKGTIEFAEAARIVRAAFPAARFRLVGWIDSNPAAITPQALEGWIREGIIEYVGRLADVRDELAGCSAFVLPSYREGTPKSVLEAMSVGRAIVTTDAPGCRETVIDGTNGFLVPVRDSRALGEACLRLCREPSLFAQFGAASRRAAEQVFDVRRVHDVLRGALGL